jgi:hypothetical protein
MRKQSRTSVTVFNSIQILVAEPVFLREEREEQNTGRGKLFNLRCLQSRDPVDVLSAQRSEIRIRDHAAIGDQDRTLKSEAFFEFDNLRFHRL